MDALLTSGIPENWTQPDDGRDLQVSVLFTGMPSTLQALRYAATLPHAQRGPVRLLIPYVVAYPLALHEPSVEISALASRYRAIVEQAAVDVTVDILLCRDPWEAIHHALATPNLVVIGGPRRWWRTHEARIAKRLRAEGHYVLYHA